MANQEEGMSKYAVDERTEGLEKFAGPTGEPCCPTCGKKCHKHGSTLICPVHGSEPFESRG